MMKRLLDTNTCIYFLNRSSDKIIAQFKKLSPSEIKLSAITVAELFFGAEKSKAKRKNWQVVERFVSTLRRYHLMKNALKYMQRSGHLWKGPAIRSVLWIF